ncbi:MAG: hypothetical protein V1872_13920 [bacterium]
MPFITTGIEENPDKELRFKFKRQLVRLMYERGKDREEVIALFEFIGTKNTEEKQSNIIGI